MVQAHLIDHPLVSTNLFLKFFKKMIFFFLMWTIFKVFIECVTILLLFYVLFFWQRGMGDLCYPTRDGTLTPCVGRQSLNHWNAREVLVSTALEAKITS